jgi:hypothetical protein
VVTAEEIISFVDDVAERYRPERIILFGSYAYGAPNADSDADILVVMPHRGPGHRLAARIRRAAGPRFPMDLLVRSAGKIEARVRGNDFFLKEVMERGLVLHAADDARVGAEGRKRLRRRLAATPIPKAQPA